MRVYHTTTLRSAYQLREIISTRVMIKNALKRAEKEASAPAPTAPTARRSDGNEIGGDDDDEATAAAAHVAAVARQARQRARTLARVLDARQFALKMIANVTYGYTSASFSGRMPMAELADAIVSTGRHTLIAAKALVEAPDAPWAPARVLYGDTDSLFVHVPGRSVRDAFAIGEAIVAAVNDERNTPREVVLKLEKVYSPCVLVAKKKYVGRSFEKPPPPELDAARGGPRGDAAAAAAMAALGHLDAKGIELARRDGCPFVTKQMEKALRLLFSTPDLSAVRRHLERQWSRALSGRASLSDFIFAKEVRRTY